jgi:hypothetical protein
MDTQSIVSALDGIGILVAVILTLFVFSYLLGDNILYRLAEHLFVGVAVGYAVVVVFHSVLAAKLLVPLVEALGQGNWGRFLLLMISLLLGLLLLTKPLKSISWLGGLSVAVLLGVGAALAIGGALLGTLVPQVNATADVARYVTRYGPRLGLFSGIVVLAGTIGVLLHFHFGASRAGTLAGLRDGIVRIWGGLGRWFILVAFAAILATTFMSRLSLLVGRIQFLLDSVRGLVGGSG